MNPLILMAVVTVIPILLMLVLKTKAAFVFMALCAGSVLATFSSKATLDVIQSFYSNYSYTAESVVLIVLLIIPALLTIFLMRRTVTGATFMLNLAPTILTGIVTLLLVVPLLPPGVRYSIFSSNVWVQLVQYQGVIVAVAVFVSCLQLWSSGKGLKHKKKHK
jgi:hypothetical protein